MRNKSISAVSAKTIALTFMILYAALNIYPLLWMILYSFKTNTEIFGANALGLPSHFRFDNYARALVKANVPRSFLNSTIVTLTTVGLVIAIASAFAYVVARTAWRARETARIYIIAGGFIPLQIIIIPLAILVKDLKLADTYASLIIPYTAFNLPFATMVFYSFFRSLPFELEEAAYIDGASLYRIFFQVILPMVKSALVAMIIFIALNVWNEFLVALLLINKPAMRTLQLMVVAFQGQFVTDWGAIGAVLVMSSIPTVTLYLFLSKQVEKAMTIGSAIKG